MNNQIQSDIENLKKKSNEDAKNYNLQIENIHKKTKNLENTADKIEKSFIVRTRKTNDYYLIYSKTEHRFQSKKIKEYMINQKI